MGEILLFISVSRYCLDVTRVMFSSGNGTEKQRIVALVAARAAAAAAARQAAPTQTAAAPTQTQRAEAPTQSLTQTAEALAQTVTAASTLTAAPTLTAALTLTAADPVDDEVILDLYTGIGYFAVPLLVHTPVRHLYLCEWNEDAVTALRRSLV